MLEAGVYIHIPFCSSKCYYCDFLSFEGKEFLFDEYVRTLLNEAQGTNFSEVSSVYIGGGTPSILPAKQMQKVLSYVSKLPLANDAEVSIEVNPGTVTKDYLLMLKADGINRLSFGLQTTCNETLAKIGRLHSFEQFLENYFAAKEVGFGNINVDLMFGLPNQTVMCFEKDLSNLLFLEPQHISFYSLTPCENTPLWNNLQGFCLPSDEADRHMYHLAAKMLADYGYRHYEISNAAKPGFECTHNINCWRHEPYIGFGLGSHSFDGKKRWSNPIKFDDYFECVDPNFEMLTNKELESEAMILGLRLIDGVDELFFESKFGAKPTSLFEQQISKLVEEGLIEIESSRIKLTSLGLDLANRVFVQFLQGTSA